MNGYDPGPCDNKIHGKEVLVKDRSEDEIILICVKNKGVYQWKPIDGRPNHKTVVQSATETKFWVSIFLQNRIAQSFLINLIYLLLKLMHENMIIFCLKFRLCMRIFTPEI